MRPLLLAFSIFVIVLADPALADSLGDTSCLDVRQVMDDFDNRKDDAFKIWHWVGIRFLVDDEAWVAAGHSSIATKWSDSGRNNNEALVTSSCGQYRSDALATRTDDVFAGLAQLESYLGATK